MEIRIAICDDEAHQAQYIKTLVAKWAENNDIIAAVTMFGSAENFKAEWNAKKSFDILLLDIQMDGQNGIELAKEIRKSDTMTAIVFITGFVDFMSEGYDVSALHYLMKPVKEEKLSEVLDKALSRLRKISRIITFPKTGGDIKIKADDIIYAEVLSHKVILYLVNNSEEFLMRISDMEKLLGGDFFKCHRSYIVSMKYVRRVTKTDLILTDGRAIPLSRNLYDAANQAFINYN